MIAELFASLSTKVFVLIIVLVLILALVLDKEGKRKRFIEYAPTLMTSLGILGTFWGVVAGLLDFDTVNIDHSIPSLLSGLKTAFVTSIAGMVAAISFNAIDSWRFADKRDAEETEQKNIRDAILKQTDLLNDIHNDLVNPEEGSVVGQLNLLRSELSERSDAFEENLWQALENFEDEISARAREHIIDALQEVVVNFNDNLTEQFGENFKALDASVKKLVDWQANYKEQIEIMDSHSKQNVESLTAMTLSMSSITDCVTQISERCQEIPASMTGLHSVIQTNQNQIANLERHLEAFILMRDQAITAVPQLQEQLDVIGNMMINSVDNLHEVFEQSGQVLLDNAQRVSKSMDIGLKQLGDAMKINQETFNQLGNTLQGGVSSLEQVGQQILFGNEKMRAAMEQGVQQIGAELITGSDKMRSTMNTGYEELQVTTSKSITIFSDAINKQLQAFELATEREITRELEVMGKALTQISQGFVSNYDQLVNNYKDVMGQLQSLLNEKEANA